MKLTKPEKQFTLIFSLILVLELICNQFESLTQWHFFTKPLIVISLIVFFFSQSKTIQKTIRNFMLLALLFSLAGDILLMYDDQDPMFFMFGLVVFLKAHIMYIIVFLKHRNKSRNLIPFIALLIIYGAGLFYLLKDGLGAMFLLVVVYMIVILTMATTAFLRKGNVPKLNYNLVFLGAILFLVSDSLLSLNMFHKTIPFANIMIMLTYGLAQFFIVLGILKQSN
jgi:uncharacterized membrane protein YhhN